MTRVDFYVPKAGGDPLAVACRLVQKAYDTGLRVHLQTRDAVQAKRVDDLLWTFRQGSFIPHALADSEEAGDAPVVIDHRDDAPSPPYQLLINVGDEVPGFFARYERVIEIVDPAADRVGRARARWRHYDERGYPLDKVEL